MLIILHKNINAADRKEIHILLRKKDLKVLEIPHDDTILLSVGNDTTIDPREIENLNGVHRVVLTSKPYKLASREAKDADKVIQIGNVKIGGNRITVMAGPCSIESRAQIIEIAQLVKQSGAVMLRGGAFKPRTSPYSFQGLGKEGLQYMKEASKLSGMPTITEIVSPTQIDIMHDYVDMFQVGARNMQNFELLKEIGASHKPVMLKRGAASTIEEWLMAAEYLLVHGSNDVVLCERGIRTFEQYTRFSLDISSIPVVKKLSHLPVIVDPSHATGLRDQVIPVALAAIAAGADGLIVEVHTNPEAALSDGPQSLYVPQFEHLMHDIQALAVVVQKEVVRLPDLDTFSPEYYGLTPHDHVAATSTHKKGRTAAHKKKSFNVAFQGNHGAYSEIAIGRFFKADTVNTVACTDFQDVFRDILEKKVQYGLVPLENSLTGSIHENYDLLLQFPDVLICGEIKIRIVHNIVGIEGATLDDVQKVYSHIQGLMQSTKFLSTHPKWEQIPYYDTAGAVNHIKQMNDIHSVAIASENAAHVYGMKVLKTEIENNPSNYTRFAILACDTLAKVENPNKTSIVFSTKNRPGALSACMKLLAEHDLNLTKLESRPILGRPWEYMFYIDIDINKPLDQFLKIIDKLKKIAEDVHILGIFRAS